jgi:hypothetical protein
MNRKKPRVFILFMAVLLAFTACDKIKSLSSETNKTPEKPDPLTQFPAEIQAFAPSNVGRFTRKADAQKSNSNIAEGVLKGAEVFRIKYKYADDRHQKYHVKGGKSFLDGKDSELKEDYEDVELTIWKLDPAKNAAQRIQEIEADSKRQTPKMKQCDPEYEASNETTGAMPGEIVKRVKHPNGGEILIVRPGLFITGNCVSKDNRSPENHAYWTDGIYLLSAASAFHYKQELGEVEGLPILEDFVADYAASGGKTTK